MKISVLGTPLTWNAGRRDQCEAAQALRRAHRHFERDPAAQRLPDDVNAREAERLDGIEIAVGHIGNVIDPGRRLGGAKTRVIEHDHIEPLRQRVEDRRPVPEPIGAMQVHQRHALAAARKAELAAVDLDRLPDELHGPTTVPMRSFAKR